MEVYGLTGGIGSGKSTVAAMLEEYGIPVVSADELSRMVVAPGSDGLTDVVAAFGAEVLDARGELDRKKMGRIVFATPERRRQLEAILHPRIRERYEQVLDALEKARHPVMVYEVPLLFEKKLDQQDEMKAVILVAATADTRIARVKDRDSLTTEDVLTRMRAQMPEQEKRARADYVIHNDGSLDDLRREVEYLLSRFLRIPPRAEPFTEESLEEIIEIEEIEESEIDTLSPEDMVDEDAATAAPVAFSPPLGPASSPAPEPVVAAAPRTAPAPSVPVAPVAPVAPVTTPRATSPAATSPKAQAEAAAAKAELEVELHPPAPSRSGSTWIPATGPQEGPALATGVPRPPAPRPRPATAPQLEVPGLADRDDEEPGS